MRKVALCLKGVPIVSKYMPYVKIIVIVLIAFFVIKLASGYIAAKWPNGITSTVNSVIQTA